MTTDKQLFLEQIESDVKIKGNKNIESPKVNIDLKIKAVLIEYKGDRDLSKKENIKSLKKKLINILKKK